MPINFTNVPARNRARGRPLKKRTNNPGCGIESTSLKTRRQRLSYSSFLRSRLLPSTIFLSLSIIFPSHSYSPPPKRVSYTHTRAENLFSGHPERDPSLFTLFRHSSRNQRYKYARTVGCWLRFQGTAKESRGAISFTRELVSAGAKMILPAPFSTNRATLSVSFPTKIHPVYPPPLYQPSLRYLNERNLERRKKRNNCNRKSTTGKKLKREEWWSVTRRTK